MGAVRVPSKQTKQTSKGLVLGAGARVQGCGLISKQGLGAGLSAVLSAMVGCKVKVFGLVRWWVLCASKGLVLCAGARCGSILQPKAWCLVLC